MGINRRFTNEFKLAAVKLVTEEGYSQAEAGRNLGISAKNLSRWVQEFKQGEGVRKLKVGQPLEQQELQALRKEVKELRLEREILKKAAAFFAKETK